MPPAIIDANETRYIVQWDIEISYLSEMHLLPLLLRTSILKQNLCCLQSVRLTSLASVYFLGHPDSECKIVVLVLLVADVTSVPFKPHS